ncbi:hypothetical protein [uncultured Phascolarctobacterium sp.]|uniref:hypothetical protein n=1 Tax=uncultured Phascolarctobacterium sp. TaxID=512296 RepID=UPI0027DB644B|nr:hypothetical protein [uncultured Phascolarctobacterium sp.]
MDAQVLMTLLFAEGLLGCLLSIRYLELKMTFSSYICINKSGYGILWRKRKLEKIYDIVLFLISLGLFIIPIKMQFYTDTNLLYKLLFLDFVVIFILARMNVVFDKTLVHNVLLHLLIRIEKEDIVRRFTYSEAEDILADYRKTLPWYNEGLTILACTPLFNKLLLEELHYVKYRYCGHW